MHLEGRISAVAWVQAAVIRDTSALLPGELADGRGVR